MVGMPEGKSSFGGPRCRWKDNIKTEFREIYVGGVLD
jgi:hypothetical protein